MSKWYQRLDDKSMHSVCNLRVNFNADLSLSEMRKLFIKALKPLVMDGVQLPQCYRATTRRQFTFCH